MTKALQERPTKNTAMVAGEGWTKEQKELIKRKLAEVSSVTQLLLINIQMEEVEKRKELEISRVQSDSEINKNKLDNKMSEQGPLDKIHQSELLRQKSRQEQELEIAEKQLEQKLSELRAEENATVQKAGAVSPQLVAALQAFSDRELAQKMADSMSPLAILGGKSISEVFSNLLKGTVLENVLKPFKKEE